VALIAHKGAVDLLLRILETKSGRISGAVMHASFGEAGRRLIESKLLLSTGQTDIFSVMDDYEDEPVRVEWSAEQESMAISLVRANGPPYQQKTLLSTK
jgi:hypothetical protein